MAKRRVGGGHIHWGAILALVAAVVFCAAMTCAAVIVK